MPHGRTRRVRNYQTGAEAEQTNVLLNPEAIANEAGKALISGLVTGLVIRKIKNGGDTDDGT